jgi:hypothetical protein
MFASGEKAVSRHAVNLRKQVAGMMKFSKGFRAKGGFAYASHCAWSLIEMAGRVQ